MKKEKRSIGFSDSAMFNYELDTNEELKKGLAALSEQIPYISEEEYRERMLALFRKSGLELNGKELEMLLLLRMKTDQMLTKENHSDESGYTEEIKIKNQGVVDMNIEKKENGKELTIILSGRLDTTTAPLLEAELKKSIGGVEKLIFDFAALEYLSSAGLRVLLAAQKVMNKQGEMVIHNINDTIAEIFEVTGFSEILTVK